jgi:hypothetical protein
MARYDDYELKVNITLPMTGRQKQSEAARLAVFVDGVVMGFHS